MKKLTTKGDVIEVFESLARIMGKSTNYLSTDFEFITGTWRLDWSKGRKVQIVEILSGKGDILAFITKKYSMRDFVLAVKFLLQIDYRRKLKKWKIKELKSNW